MSKTVSSPLGVVDYQFITVFDRPEDKLELQSGATFGPITVAYQTYGTLNSSRDNVILVCHALSGDSHIAGLHAENNRLGWWEIMIGPGKPLDTNRYFIICSNVFGGCKGTTGPASLNPRTAKPYALEFPIITIEDMVRVQRRLLAELGVTRLLTVIGGSMGGMQALAWSKLYPDMVASVIPIATSARLTAQGIAWNEIGRKAIMADKNWNNGNYYEPEQPRPEAGLAVARMVGHLTYLSEESMSLKFGRRLQHQPGYSYSFGVDFEVESYLAHQGATFNQRFDANSYLYITRAMDYFDMSDGTGDLSAAFARTTARFLFISFSSDWLYPPNQSAEMVNALQEGGRAEYVEYLAATSIYGHDAFLLEVEQQGPLITKFLQTIEKLY